MLVPNAAIKELRTQHALAVDDGDRTGAQAGVDREDHGSGRADDRGRLAVSMVWGDARQPPPTHTHSKTPLPHTLLASVGITLTLSSALTVVGVFVVRRRGLRAAYRTPGHPLTPIAFVGLSAWTIVSAAITDPTVTVWGGLAIGAGLLLCLWARRHPLASGRNASLQAPLQRDSVARDRGANRPEQALTPRERDGDQA